MLDIDMCFAYFIYMEVRDTMRLIVQEYATLVQCGSSKVVKIPDTVLKLLDININQKFLISVQGQSIVLTPEIQKPTNIYELFSNWEDDGVRHNEINWGEAKGEEMKW